MLAWCCSSISTRTVPGSPFAEAHFAAFPPALIEPCILAGAPLCGTVLDPSGGSGTTGLVAQRLERNAILCELNPKYAEMASARIRFECGMVDGVAQPKPTDGLFDFVETR